MKQIRWFLVAAFGVIALVFSCQEEEYCTLPLVSRVNIGFYGMQEGELVPKPVNKFWSAGLGQDSVINGDSTDVDKLVLELSDSQDSCTFVFTSSRY
jgi:hypothetical protein